MVTQHNSNDAVKKEPLGDDKNLMAIAQYVKNGPQSHKRAIPPLEQWQPQHCGKMDLRIKANGEWWHEGQLIQRQSLIDLFATVLWKEDGKFYLRTPQEQIEIEVEDEPFLVNRVDQVLIGDQIYLQCITTTHDVVVVDAEHPIFMRDYQGEVRPYIHVRFGMNALIQRQAFYHLVNYGELLEDEQGHSILSLQSGDLHLQLGT